MYRTTRWPNKQGLGFFSPFIRLKRLENVPQYIQFLILEVVVYLTFCSPIFPFGENQVKYSKISPLTSDTKYCLRNKKNHEFKSEPGQLDFNSGFLESCVFYVVINWNSMGRNLKRKVAAVPNTFDGPQKQSNF